MRKGVMTDILSFMTLNMILSLLFFALSIIIPFFVVLFAHPKYDLNELPELLITYALFFNVGCLFLAGCVGQFFYGADIAAEIGWSWSPFQYELAFSELSIAILGFVSPVFDKGFWLATIIATVVWLLGGSAVHLYYLFAEGNQAVLNASFAIAWNICIAFWLIGLYLAFKAVRTQNRWALKKDPESETTF